MYEIPKDKIIWKKVEYETVVLDTDSGVYYVLDELGSFIWDGLSSQKLPSQIVDDVIFHYDTDLNRIQKDMDQFLNDLLREGIIRQSANVPLQEENSRAMPDRSSKINSKKPYTAPSVKKFDDILQWGFGS